MGECTVDMPLREIHAPGARRPRRVTPKAIGVLAALIEQGGRVVSRDALLAQVWAGTLPSDDVVTQAITQLRKAFDDERGNPRYIETIAKYGYRLLAPVEVAGCGAEPTAWSHVAGRVRLGAGGARRDGRLRPDALDDSRRLARDRHRAGRRRPAGRAGAGLVAAP